MTPVQLDLLAPVEPLSTSQETTGGQHAAVLAAFLAFIERGATGEEVAVYCDFRANHIATTRLGEMSVEGNRDRFPVPLVAKSATKERACASGRRAYVWRLTDAGRTHATRGASA